MKTLMLYICAMIVGFLLAVALFIMVAIIALPIILMFILDNWWVLLIYAPFIAYFTWQKTDTFFEKNEITFKYKIMITLSICLTDLPKDAIQTGKNGKKYINLVVDKRKAESQFGETHTVYLSQSKEQRDAKADKVYVGGGKEYVFGSSNEQQKHQATQSKPKAEPQVDDDSLPF